MTQQILLTSGKTFKKSLITLSNLNLRDTANNCIDYEPVSIIEFQGTVRQTGESEGHYLCDIKDRSSGAWFRTNDNYDPQQIDKAEVSKIGYVILYRKMNN